jgi:hypothetical protein
MAARSCLENDLGELVAALKKCNSDRDRIEVIDHYPPVHRWRETPGWLRTFSAHLSQECELVIKSLIAIGQEDCLLPSGESGVSAERLRNLLEDLFPVQTFYREIGGIVGYHWTLISLMSGNPGTPPSECVRYHRPGGIDLSMMSDQVRRYTLEGIASIPLLAEIYPVGGAADRLKFCDPSSGQPLPAAKLHFCGHSLLEGLIRDVQGREYLYYKLYGKQTTTPIAMMTSPEKGNHHQLLELCESKNWFGRPKSSFRFFCQPVVPTMDKNGRWCLTGPMKLLMKPGGHGVMWKVAQEEGIFDWMKSLGRLKVLIRQINNPIAGIDHGILAFCGLGFGEDRSFGFASCPREVGSAEGVNIVLERSSPSGSSYCLTSIEYCDFPKFGIEDVPVAPESSYTAGRSFFAFSSAHEPRDRAGGGGDCIEFNTIPSPASSIAGAFTREENAKNDRPAVYSRFPSNTNILFADLGSISRAIARCPIPGMLVNLKKIQVSDEEGNQSEMEVARLESTMQNLADCFEEVADTPMPMNDLRLSTYLTYNHRRKTISTTKKLFGTGSSLLETPEGCYYDLLLNAHDLLTNYCHISLPALPEPEVYIAQGPHVIFFYHPALGPLFSIIGQKLRGGSFGLHSELKLEIAEVDIEQLTLEGSLHVIAEEVIGERGPDGMIVYSDAAGKCTLHNVTVKNPGVDKRAHNVYWKEEITRLGLCEIVIRGNGEFIARNVALCGSQRIVVESGTRTTAFEASGHLELRTEPLHEVSRGWIYRLAEDGLIRLE